MINPHRDPQKDPGNRHPKEWLADLNPDDFADMESLPTSLADKKDAKDRFPDFTMDELRRIPVVPEGTPLTYGEVYIDAKQNPVREFRADQNTSAGPDRWYVPKKITDYEIWNRICEVKYKTA